MIECLKIHCFEKHEGDISKLNSIQISNDNKPDPSSSIIICSARLVPGVDESSNNLTSRRSKFKNSHENIHYRFLPTREHLIYSNSNILAMQSISDKIGDSEAIFFPQPNTYSKHKTPILLVQASAEGWFVISCSDDTNIIWKWDSLLKKWDNHQVSLELGRITSAAICCKDNKIYITLGRPGDLLIIECSAKNNFSSVGMLNLNKIFEFASLDKLTEPCVWLDNQFLGDSLHIVGLSTSSGIYLKVWSGTLRAVKLKFRSSLQMKTLSSADVLQNSDSFYVFAMSSDGCTEVYFCSTSCLTLINRIKLDEPQIPALGQCSPRRESLMGLGTSGFTPAEVEFRVVSAKFLVMNKIPVGTDGFHSNETLESELTSRSFGGGDEPDLDNSLALPKSQKSLYPKLHVVVATTKGISIVNVRSGEYEFQLNYKDIKKIGEMVASNAQLACDFEKNEIICAIHPFLQNSLSTFRITVQESVPQLQEDESSPSTASLVFMQPTCPKSVLRKKLKSPTRPHISIVTRTKSKFSNSSTKVASPSRSKTTSLVATQSKISQKSVQPEFQLNTTMMNQSFGVSASQSYKASKSSSEEFLYNSKIDVQFDESTTPKLNIETRMSDGLSYMRMAFSSDGKFLATCGNISPLLVHKVTSKLENIGTYRDLQKVTSVGFSFNSKYMILATNDGNTAILNWKYGHKLLFTLDFTSKFNEHIHSQFYYMDKFILQPEDNRIALYSYRVQEPITQKLKAGSFTLNCQSITALAAANQLYSNLIFCGGSNKSMYIFDANVEKVAWTIPNAHSKNISCIRLNEAPKGSNAMSLCDYFMTSSNTTVDPIKLWDLRNSKCVIKIADTCLNNLVANTRPSLSPCGRYIASGFEENSLAVYDVRKINSRLATFRGLKSSILDTVFDPQHPTLWAGSKNGSLWNFTPQQ